MASAMQADLPNRKGPFSAARQSRQMLTIRSMARCPMQKEMQKQQYYV
jgi:hypothetical protein